VRVPGGGNPGRRGTGPKGILVALLLTGLLPGLAVAAAGPDFEESRARITESTLRDLSRQNEAGLKSISDTPRPALVPGQRVDLSDEGPPTTAALVRGDVQSSLNRLRRETVSARTADGRQARIDESVDRRLMDDAGAAVPAPAVSPRQPEFSPMRDDRLNLRPDDHPLNVSARDPGAGGTQVESTLHRLTRRATGKEAGAEGG
jgi:hypothetical protein